MAAPASLSLLANLLGAESPAAARWNSIAKAGDVSAVAPAAKSGAKSDASQSDLIGAALPDDEFHPTFGVSLQSVIARQSAAIPRNAGAMPAAEAESAAWDCLPQPAEAPAHSTSHNANSVAIPGAPAVSPQAGGPLAAIALALNANAFGRRFAGSLPENKSRVTDDAAAAADDIVSDKKGKKEITPDAACLPGIALQPAQTLPAIASVASANTVLKDQARESATPETKAPVLSLATDTIKWSAIKGFAGGQEPTGAPHLAPNPAPAGHNDGKIAQIGMAPESDVPSLSVAAAQPALGDGRNQDVPNLAPQTISPTASGKIMDDAGALEQPLALRSAAPKDSPDAPASTAVPKNVSAFEAPVEIKFAMLSAQLNGRPIIARPENSARPESPVIPQKAGEPAVAKPNNAFALDPKPAVTDESDSIYHGGFNKPLPAHSGSIRSSQAFTFAVAPDYATNASNGPIRSGASNVTEGAVAPAISAPNQHVPKSEPAAARAFQPESENKPQPQSQRAALPSPDMKTASQTNSAPQTGQPASALEPASAPGAAKAPALPAGLGQLVSGRMPSQAFAAVDNRQPDPAKLAPARVRMNNVAKSAAQVPLDADLARAKPVSSSASPQESVEKQLGESLRPATAPKIGPRAPQTLAAEKPGPQPVQIALAPSSQSVLEQNEPVPAMAQSPAGAPTSMRAFRSVVSAPESPAPLEPQPQAMPSAPQSAMPGAGVSGDSFAAAIAPKNALVGNASQRPSAPALDPVVSQIVDQTRRTLAIYPERRAATFQVSPPELGKVSVEIVMKADNTAQTVIQAHSAQGRDALMRNATQLSQEFERQGLPQPQISFTAAHSHMNYNPQQNSNQSAYMAFDDRQMQWAQRGQTDSAGSNSENPSSALRPREAAIVSGALRRAHGRISVTA